MLDGLDRCPRTPTGTSINATGCPTTPEQPLSRLRGERRRLPHPRTPPRPHRCGRGRRGGGCGSTAWGTGRGGERERLTPGVIPGVAFATGSARLLPQSYVPLDSIAEILKADTTVKIEVGAHIDNTGAPSQTEHLTNLQAEAVRTYLVTRGVSFQQVQARGYGSAFPLTTDNTPRGRAANRRVEIKLGL